MCKHFHLTRKLIKDVTFIKNLQMKSQCTKAYMYTLRKTVIPPGSYTSFYTKFTTRKKIKLSISVKHQDSTKKVLGSSNV